MLDYISAVLDVQLETIVLSTGFLVFLAVIAAYAYWAAETKEKKKDVLMFLGVFGSVAAVSLAVLIFFFFA